MRSYLVDCPPVRSVIGTSTTHPNTFTRDPGLLFRSVMGETKSSLRKTLMRFGCEASKSSGDSSRTNPCPSTSSLEISLNFPFLPHPHREGSLNFLSSCSTLIIFPQEGHSNLVAVTCGRRSEERRVGKECRSRG